MTQPNCWSGAQWQSGPLMLFNVSGPELTPSTGHSCSVKDHKLDWVNTPRGTRIAVAAIIPRKATSSRCVAFTSSRIEAKNRYKRRQDKNRSRDFHCQHLKTLASLSIFLLHPSSLLQQLAVRLQVLPSFEDSCLQPVR